MENATDPVAFAAVLVPLKVAVSWIDVPTVIEDDDSVVLIEGCAWPTVTVSDLQGLVTLLLFASPE
jgi:hypothetical protein